MDLSKLGRTERVLSAAGILLFIVSFFPWFSASLDLGVAGTYSVSRNGWSNPSGFNDWFPVLLLLVYGVVLALPAFGVAINAPLLANPTNRAFIGLVLSAFAVLLFAIQGLAYPGASDIGATSAGPSWGYYIALLIALAAGVQSYLGFTQQGGSFANVGAAFKARTQAVQAQQPPVQPGHPPYGGQPQQPYQQQSYGQPPTFGQAPQQPMAPQEPQQPYQQQPPTPPYGS